MIVEKNVQLGIPNIKAISPINEDKDLVQREDLIKLLHQIADKTNVTLANIMILRVCLFRLSTQEVVRDPRDGSTFRYHFVKPDPKDSAAFIYLSLDSDEVKSLVFELNQSVVHGAKCVTESVMRKEAHKEVNSIKRMGCTCLDKKMKIVRSRSNSPEAGFPFEYVPAGEA